MVVFACGGRDGNQDIERGKTLVIVNQATSATDSQGMVTTFFELNGQPRRIKGAPMPGVISRVFVSPGQAVNAGDVLVSIEAMKMETALRAEKDSPISEVLVRAGGQIGAKELLLVYGA